MASSHTHSNWPVHESTILANLKRDSCASSQQATHKQATQQQDTQHSQTTSKRQAVNGEQPDADSEGARRKQLFGDSATVRRCAAQGIVGASDAASSLASVELRKNSLTLTMSSTCSLGSSLAKGMEHINDTPSHKSPARRSKLGACCVTVARRCMRFVLLTQLYLIAFMAVLCVLSLLVPYGAPGIRVLHSPPRPRPKFEGALAINERLDAAAPLFEEEFHAPESLAWLAPRNARGSFFTGVEGGFVLRVWPAEQRWQVAARLNARDAVIDESSTSLLQLSDEAPGDKSAQQNASDAFAPFCERDLDLYGPRAEFEPRAVVISRCSRPLGLRLAPSQDYLYAVDPLSGLFKLERDLRFASPNDEQTQMRVSKLVDFSRFQDLSAPESPSRVLFADDLAVDWAASELVPRADILYISDCSSRWSLRFLTRLILENDATGRILVFDSGARTMRILSPITPTVYLPHLAGRFPTAQTPIQLRAAGAPQATDGHSHEAHLVDRRDLSFPNGVELTANGSALLIADLNNRRILMRHLRGPLAGQTAHLLWVPGYPDNVRRGLDTRDGRPTYWTGCGCATSDASFELAEFANGSPNLTWLFLRVMSLVGKSVELFGRLLDSRHTQDFGSALGVGWFLYDPYCAHGIVLQFTEEGEVLQSLHAPHFRSKFKLLSEASQVPLSAFDDEQASFKTSSTSGGQPLVAHSLQVSRAKNNTETLLNFLAQLQQQAALKYGSKQLSASNSSATSSLQQPISNQLPEVAAKPIVKSAPQPQQQQPQQQSDAQNTILTLTTQAAEEPSKQVASNATLVAQQSNSRLLQSRAIRTNTQASEFKYREKSALFLGSVYYAFLGFVELRDE